MKSSTVRSKAVFVYYMRLRIDYIWDFAPRLGSSCSAIVRSFIALSYY